MLNMFLKMKIFLENKVNLNVFIKKQQFVKLLLISQMG